MSKSIFISTVFEDSHRANSLKEWAEKKRLGNVAITHETEDKRPEGEQAIRKHLADKIKGAAAVAVFIGDDTHNHPWVKAEIELANTYHKPIIGIRLPYTKGAVPDIMKNKPIASFEPDSIKKTLDNLNKNGK
jgi:hypothetical protein